MKHGFIKIGAACIKTAVGNPLKNAEEIIKTVQKADSLGVKLLCFSELCVTGCNCGDLFYSDILICKAKKALLEIAEKTSNCDTVFTVGLPVRVSSKIYNCAVVIHGGSIMGIVPQINVTDKHFTPFDAEKTEYLYDFIPSDDGYVQTVPFSTNITFYCKGVENYRFAICVGNDLLCMQDSAKKLCARGAKIILNPASSKETVCSNEKRKAAISASCGRYACCVVSSLPDESDTTASGVYSANHMIGECGKILCENAPFGEEKLLITETDVSYIAFVRGRDTLYCESTAAFSSACDFNDVEIEQQITQTPITRKISKNPFMPDGCDMAKRADHIFEIQARALCKRMNASYSKKMIIGISGGLDSTLALLVCVKACGILGYPNENVIAVTMPCFGTTKRTKSNAQILCKSLGVDFRTVDISNAVKVHFADICHDEGVRNAAYENSQARERTQILMDIANDENALVIGTGDLSELALGWCTYNGDHMSMYGVNCSIPKTLMRYIVGSIAKTEEEKKNTDISRTLYDILETPVSPELIPPKDGQITQCTEEIIGSYELHDFFIYHTIHSGYGKEKLLLLAKYVFAGEYSEEYIEKYLNLFCKRFATQQFKRSCSPDGAIVGSVNISPACGFYMPSDVDGDVLL